jgi:hypothetical protein
MTVAGQGVATIQGVLLKADGKPRQYTEIELVPLGINTLITDSRLISASATNGKFTFYNVPPGRYTLSINFDDRPSELSPYPTFFFPDTFDRQEADIFAIDNTSRIRNIVFKLPPALTLTTVKGRVVWEDGSPLTFVSVGCLDLLAGRRNGYGSVGVDRAGNFRVNVFEGRKYRLGAVVLGLNASGNPLDPATILGGGESEIFIPGPTNDMIEIKLRRSPDSKSIFDRYIA